ncbi:acyl-CoA thioesterase [Seongchinamella unica]|uniref:Acyl-CoA thioesterase n=1 Tax=Seongchinamella unica TaxID=2547392 RepID=A0A4R5LQ29_9GAMM|nr:thioesterase family protein [Seongchinamella unica]TDG12674.1 acyl-CoA thioesterase [Seongchinamella unica]
MSREQVPVRDDYRVFYPILTRWADNDIYGHVNNVTYYAYFDSAANRYLIEEGGLDIGDGSIVGYVVNSGCAYHSPVSYPDELEAGLRVDRLGNSSVQYGLAIFRKGEQVAVANGHFVHVFVERARDKAVSIPASIRTALEKILVDS